MKMENPWIAKCKAYHLAHPELSYKEVLMALGKKNRKQRGGNAIVGAVAGAVPGTISAIANAVNEGIKLRDERDKLNGNLNYEKNNRFMDYYRNLLHWRFWDGERFPPYLRLPRYETNNPQYAAKQEEKDNLMYQYAKETWNGTQTSM